MPSFYLEVQGSRRSVNQPSGWQPKKNEKKSGKLKKLKKILGALKKRKENPGRTILLPDLDTGPGSDPGTDPGSYPVTGLY